MEDKKKSIKCGVSHDRLCTDLFTWKGITFWATPEKKNSKAYKQFDVYSMKDLSTYRLIRNNVFEQTHPSGWDLQKIRMGEVVPSMIISDHATLKNSSFEELFAVLSVLIDEEELFSFMLSIIKPNPDFNILDQVSKSEITRLRKKWKMWTKDRPDWLQPTIDLNNKLKETD